MPPSPHQRTEAWLGRYQPLQGADAGADQAGEVCRQIVGQGTGAGQPAADGAVGDAQVSGERCLPTRSIEGLANAAEVGGGHSVTSVWIAAGFSSVPRASSQ